MAKVSTLVDALTTFDGAVWHLGPTGATHSSGKFHFNASNYDDAWASTWGSYDLTNSSVVFKMDSVPSTSANDGPFFRMQLQDQWPEAHTGNRLVWYYEPSGPGTGDLIPRTYTAAGAVSDGTSIPWPAGPIYLKIADDGTNIIWSSSTNGTSYTTRRTLARPAGFGLTAMYVTMFGTNNATETGTFDIDAINPAVGPQTQAASTAMAVTAGRAVAYTPSSNALGAFTDEFDNTALPLWTKFGGVTASGGVLHVPVTDYGAFPNGVQSATKYDMTGSSVIFDLTGLPTPNAGAETFLDMQVCSTAVDSTENRVSWFVYQTTSAADTIEARYRVGGVDTPVNQNIPRKRYLRLRHLAPNMLWETSADGTAWTTAATVPTSSLFAINSVYVAIVAKGFGTGTYDLSAVNPGVGAAATAPDAPATLSATSGVQQSVLTWTAGANGGSAITGYEVSWTPGQTTPIPLGNVLTYTTPATLTPGTLYTFSVKAKNAIGTGAAKTATATPTAPAPTGVPGAPTGVTATAGNATAAVSWTAPGTTNGTITGYDVLDQNSVVRASVTGTGTSTTVSGLTNGMQYTFRVVAKNATGSSIPSTVSNTVTPVASSTSAALYTRSTLGAAAPDYTVLEPSLGQALQPVVLYVKASDTPASIAAKVTAATDRNRRCLLMLSTSGWNADALRTGVYNAELTALGTALAGTGVPVFVAPLYEANDWKHPWSPYYGTTSPGYDATLWAELGSTDEYKQAFDKVVRKIRAAAPLARFVWVASVEDQPGTSADDWASFYPGAVADVICLKGLNYGNGPAQGGGTTVWQTASQIFDTPMATAEALHATKPIWILTGSHEPSTVYSPVGPGFPAGASVAVDATKSKGTWLTDLLNKTTWPRVTTVALYGISGTRNWSLTSSTASSNAIKATIDSTWGLTQVTQDQMGDYVRDATTKYANWLRSGTTPATYTNPYARPDKAAAGGVRGSLVFGVPYSPGQKTLVSIPTADMLAWNRVHGELLRQCARNGMQGWAFASGALADADPVLLFDGTVASGRTTLATGRDALPGNKMQIEAGLKDAEGGTAPAGVPAPITSIQTTIGNGLTDPTTEIALVWTPLTATQLTGYTLSGYRFGYVTTDAAEPDKTWETAVIPATTATSPFVFSTLVPGVTYDVYVEAVMANGQTGRTTKSKKTDPVVFSQTPSAPTSVTASNLTDTTMTVNWQPPSNIGASAITGYYVSWGGWTSAVQTAATRSMDLTGFTADSPYTIDVWATNTQGAGTHYPLSVRTAKTTTVPPGTTNPALLGIPTTTRLAGAFVPTWSQNPINANGYSANWNLLFMFSATSNGDGAYKWTSSNPINITAARAAGKRIILSLGGAGNVYNFTTRAASDRCVASIVAINTQWGGTTTNPMMDGVDFNTFEAQALSNSRELQTTEYIYMGQKLKQTFGANFIVHGPPAPWNTDDQYMCQKALAAGAFDIVSPQYYDGGLATFNTVNGPDTAGSSIAAWIKNVAGGNASKIGVGWGLDWNGDGPPNYMAKEEIDRSWVDLETRFPGMRCAWIWRSDFDTDSTGNSSNGNYFSGTTCPKIRSL